MKKYGDTTKNSAKLVPSTALWRWWALTCPPGDHPVRKFLEKDLKRNVSARLWKKRFVAMTCSYLKVQKLERMGSNITVPRTMRLYDSSFSNVSLRIISPLKSCDGKMSVEYAVMVIYGMSFMHPCVHAVYTEVCGAKA